MPISNSDENQETPSSNPLGGKPSTIRWINNLNKTKRKTIKENEIHIETEVQLKDMIAKAEIHRKANRPLIKLKEFDGNTKFCQCCYLPAEDGEYLRKTSFCENTDKFADYGRGTSLYFSYFRFSIYILVFALLSMALPFFFLTNYYTNQLIDTCGKLYKIHGDGITKTFSDCVNFINIQGVSEYFIKNGDWEFKYNGINLKYFRKIYKNIVGSDDNVDKILTNYHIATFIALVALFIINLLYIILLYNINHQYDLYVTSPSDFTIIVSNLHSAFEVFYKNIKKINKEIKKAIESKDKNYNFDECKNEIELLGLKDYPKDKEINIFEGFNYFIKNKICVNSKSEKFKIYRINICYKINEFMEKEERIQELKKKIYKVEHQKYQKEKNNKLNPEGDARKYFYNPIQNLGLTICNCGECCEKSELLSDILKEKEKLESELKELYSHSENLTEENFSGVVFVTFNNIGEVEKIMEPLPKNLIMSIFVWLKSLKYFLCCCCVNKSKRDHFFLKRNVSIKVAPEPEDVIFENLQYTALGRFLRTFLVYFLSLIIIFICFIIILFLNDVQIEKMKKNSNNFVMKYGISISITLIISSLNTIFQLILQSLTKKEKQISNTDYYLSFSIKLTIFTFLTSGVIPLVSSYYHSTTKYDLLLANMLTLFLSNSFLTPIMWSLNFELLRKGLKICLIKNNYTNYTQDEINKVYELLNMNVSYKYSYIFKTLLMSFLYMPIFPLGIGISFFGFIFGYFLEKLNFSRMYKKPEMLNSKICEFYSNYFIIIFFMLCLGNYIFLRDNNKSNLWCISNLIISGALIIIPYNQIFVCDFIGIKESEIKGDQTYESFNLTFYNDYEKINPMTRIEAIKNFLKKLLSDHLITQSEYDKILKNIDKINLMETYYKARKNFAESLLLKAFMNMPDTDNKRNKKDRKSFMERLKEHSRKNQTNIFNLLFPNLNHNINHNNANNTNINERNNSITPQNNNLIHENGILRHNTQGKRNKKKNNSLVHFANQINNNINSNIDSIEANREGNNIHINININVLNDKDENKEKKNNNDNRRKSSLSKKNMDIFAHLIKTEQRKILSYYKNPVLFSMKRMMEGIIFHDNNNTEEDKKDSNKNLLSRIEENNKEDDININESNRKEIIENSGHKEIKKTRKIKIKVKKKIKIKVKKKKKKSSVEYRGNNIIIDDI